MHRGKAADGEVVGRVKNRMIVLDARKTELEGQSTRPAILPGYWRWAARQRKRALAAPLLSNSK